MIIKFFDLNQKKIIKSFIEQQHLIIQFNSKDLKKIFLKIMKIFKINRFLLAKIQATS